MEVDCVAEPLLVAEAAAAHLDQLDTPVDALGSAIDALVFDENERPITDDLQHHFEAVSKLPESERAIARALLEGLVLKHDAKRFERTAET